MRFWTYLMLMWASLAFADPTCGPLSNTMLVPTRTGTATVTDTPTNTPTRTASVTPTTPGVGGFAPLDWTQNSHVVAAYSSGATWTIGVNVAASGSCGGTAANCDMTNNGTMTQDTGTELVSGLPSLKSTGTTQYGSCASGTCSALNIATGGDFAWMSWINPIASTDSWAIDTFQGPTTSTTGGYELRVRTGVNWACYTCTGGACNGDAVGTAPAGTWAHVLCHFGNTSATLAAYENNVIGGLDTGRTYAQSNATTYTSPGVSGWTGGMYTYETVVWNGVWSTGAASDEGRVVSCGMSGLLCMCDASTHANYKTCSANGDCQVNGNTTAVCDTTSGLCQGFRHTLNADGTLPACDANPSAGS